MPLENYSTATAVSASSTTYQVTNAGSGFAPWSSYSAVDCSGSTSFVSIAYLLQKITDTENMLLEKISLLEDRIFALEEQKDEKRVLALMDNP